MFEPSNLDLKSHTAEKKRGILWRIGAAGLSGFPWPLQIWGHLLVWDVPGEKGSGGDVSEDGMLGMRFYGSSQHTASLTFCNWSVLSECCSPCTAVSPWQEVDRRTASVCCVCVSLVCCLMPRSWTLPFLIWVFVVFFDRADVRDTINWSYLFKMTRSSIICLPSWIQPWCENCFFHLLPSKKTTTYIKSKDGFEFGLFFGFFYVQSQPPLPLSLAFLLLLPSLQKSTYGTAFLSSLIIWTPLSLPLCCSFLCSLPLSFCLSMWIPRRIRPAFYAPLVFTQRENESEEGGGRDKKV